MRCSVRTVSFLFIALITAVVYAASIPASGKIKGAFRTDKRTYCVGEPIFVQFVVSNESDGDFHFNLGADPSGSLRQNFSFSARSQGGYDLTAKLDEGRGGVIQPHIVESGDERVFWLVLNMWTHLMPPGRYMIHCHADLRDDLILPDDRERSASVTFVESIEFSIDAYRKLQIVEAIRNANRDNAAIARGHRITDPKPVTWALATLAQQFQIDAFYTGDDAKFANTVLGALPERWNERFYAEYSLKMNRNWVRKILPEELILTFCVRNNSDRPRQLFFRESDLYVNASEIKTWRQAIGNAIRNAKITDVVPPGTEVEIEIPSSDFLNGDEVQKIVAIRQGCAQKPHADARFRCILRLGLRHKPFRRHIAYYQQLDRGGHSKIARDGNSKKAANPIHTKVYAHPGASGAPRHAFSWRIFERSEPWWLSLRQRVTSKNRRP
jgi:hypothetical protein